MTHSVELTADFDMLRKDIFYDEFKNLLPAPILSFILYFTSERIYVTSI